MYYQFNIYNDLLIYSIFVLGFSFFILGLCYAVAPSNLYREKTSAYECGFDPFSDAREPFFVKFYLVAILFLIFDVEVVFFFPWAICFRQVLFFGFYVLYVFFFLLVLGFFYEYRKGSLDWD